MKAPEESTRELDSFRKANLLCAEFLINLDHGVIPQHGIGMTEDEYQQYLRLVADCNDAQHNLDASRT